MEKILSCSSTNIESNVQPFLDQGWKVKHMTSESVAITMSSKARPYEDEDIQSIRGDIIVVLKKK